MPFMLRPFRRFPGTYNAGLLLKLPLAYFSGFWLLIALLVLSSGPAYGEWVPVATNDEMGLTVYVDHDTIRRKGDLVKMWALYDFKNIQTVAGDSLLSSKIQTEYDCQDERSRQLKGISFSGNMGGGRVVFTESLKVEWRSDAPESIGQGLWKVACGKK